MPLEMTRKYLMKPSLTMDDLHDVYAAATDKAENDAVHRVTDQVMKITYACAVSTLHREFGWGHDRCMRFLKAFDDDVLQMADKDEALERALDDVKISIKFHDGINRFHKK